MASKTECTGAGQPVEMVTQIGGSFIGRCGECGHAVECSADGVARVHYLSDVLTLF